MLGALFVDPMLTQALVLSEVNTTEGLSESVFGKLLLSFSLSKSLLTLF